MTPPSSATEARPSLLGPAFAHALARRDWPQVMSLLKGDIGFAALTPRRAWEAPTAELAVQILAGWFDDSILVGEVISVRSDEIGGRCSVTYRFAGEQAVGPFVIEQHAYFTVDEGRIDWMRLVCSGFQPTTASPA
jgi:hypothetical protein